MHPCVARAPSKNQAGTDAARGSKARNQGGDCQNRRKRATFRPDVKRDFSSKARAFASFYRRDFDRDGNFTFEYGRGESGEVVTDVESCKGKGNAIDAYVVVLDEVKDPMFVQGGLSSDRSKPVGRPHLQPATRCCRHRRQAHISG